MHHSESLKRILAAIVTLTLSFHSIRAQDRPEVFVQTGHSRGAEKLALSDNQKFLVSAEGFGVLKLWDVEAAREIRTVKVDGIAQNVYFIDNDRFIVLFKERGDIYNTSGTRIRQISIPSVEGYGNTFITKSGKYLVEVADWPAGVRFFDIRDGSEIKMPEQNIDSFRSNIIDMGSGWFGIFFDEYKRVPDIKNNGNTGYVIFNEDLQVTKRGVLKGIIGIGGRLKADRDLKFLYEVKNYGDKPELRKTSLENGELICSIPLTKQQMHDYTLLPDGRFLFGYNSRNEIVNQEYFIEEDLTLIAFLDNCLYKEKKILLKNLCRTNSYIVGKDALLIASHMDGSIRRYDTFTGQETMRFGVRPVVYNGSSYSNGRLLNLWQDFSVSTKEAKVTFNLWNLKNASLEQFNVVTSTKEVYQKVHPLTGFKLWHLSNPAALYAKIPKDFYPDDFKPGEHDNYDAAIGYPYVYMKSPATKDFQYTNKENYLAVVQLPSKTEVARLYAFSNGEWIIITPEGYFNASTNGARLLNVRVGNNVYSIDNFYEKFYNPVIVASVLQGTKVEAVADLRKGILAPPEVKIISPGAGKECTADTLTIAVSAKDVGGGIDEIRLYQNGKAVGGDTRGMKAVPKGNETIRTFTVTLVDGVNTFRATAFSKDRSESNPYELTVLLAAPRKEVSLHVLAVGINTYKNPALSLNYAEPDARGIVGFFRRVGKGLFKDMDIREMYNDQATKQSIIAGLGRLQNTNPQDAVLIYLAGHGESINDKWYFVPYELTFPEREEDVVAKALSSDELKDFITRIKAQKILILIDACKSGAVLVAFRGFEDRKALSQLSRSTGVHVVAASAKDQFAAEVKELGHGVFTYTLLQGLNGKAVGKGEAVTVRKLMAYIEEQLPEITKKYKQEAQYPVVDSRGMDFPLAPAN
jgi:hypothetical protein